MKTTYLITMLGAALWVAGCASDLKVSDLAPAGPECPHGDVVGGSGYLKVYSATEEFNTGDNTYYYPHTDYVIYDAGGKVFAHVRNHVGIMDETPALVRLPAGSYKVAAEDSGYGRIRVPVVVESGRTTTIHLDRAWDPPAHVAASELIRLPDGEYLGWRDQFDKQSQGHQPDSKGN